MSILHRLGDGAQWDAYLNRKRHDQHTHPSELRFLEAFVAEARYLPLAQQMLEEDYLLPLPRRALVSKNNTDKKRIIYFYPPDEHQMLKLLNHLMIRKYDDRLSDACHSFRVGHSVKTAVRSIGQLEGLEHKYSLKLDLSSYGNSIPVEPLLAIVEEALRDDPLLLRFLSRMLRRSQALWRGQVISEPMGAMSGVPTTGFFENLYLRDVDDDFLSRGIPYFRYGDDILILTDTRQEQQDCLQRLTDLLIREKGLKLNPEKTCLTEPGEAWEYLGISYVGGEYDLARITVEKTKARIRRYARYLYREKCCRQHLSSEEAASIFLRRFNAMFFNTFEDNEFAWNRWYFSVITTSKSLREIDAHMQRYLRYLFTGSHGKQNYRISYGALKALGYRSLVHEYYEYLKHPPEPPK